MQAKDIDAHESNFSITKKDSNGTQYTVSEVKHGDLTVIFNQKIINILILLFAVNYLSKAETTEREINVNGFKAMVRASSELASPKTPRMYSPEKAFDGIFETAWVEGNPNNGKGQWIEIVFTDDVPLNGFIVYPGYLKSLKTFTENCAPLIIKIEINEKILLEKDIAYKKSFLTQEADNQSALVGEGCFPASDTVNQSPRVFILNKQIVTQSIKFTVMDVLQGSKYNDLAISEIIFITTGGNQNLSFDLEIADVLSFRDHDQKLLSNLEKMKLPQLSEKCIYWDQDKGWIYTDNSLAPQNAKQKKSRINSDNLKPIQEWQNIFDSLFINEFSTLVKLKTGSALLGKKSMTAGDGEWIELYPAIIFGSNGAIKTFTEFEHKDGAPGCHDVIPDIRQEYK